MLQQIELTADEETKFADMCDELVSRGYVNVKSHGELRVGARIRHVGQQYAQAYRDGTGFVVALFEKPDSSWSQAYRMPDIEMVVLYDKPRLSSSRLAQLAQYHVTVIEVAE